jgi:excisionase family DNA binding protein
VKHLGIARTSHSGFSPRLLDDPAEGCRGASKPNENDGVDRMLTATEVAALFRVSSKTVGRWGRSGALPLYRTVGGHHRYRLSDVRAFLGLDTEAAVGG